MPLKKQEWQTDVTMAAYFSILQENSSKQKAKTIDFTSIAKIFCGIGRCTGIPNEKEETSFDFSMYQVIFILFE